MHTHAKLLARALEGAWRLEPPANALTAEELDNVLESLTGSGAAPLAWWRLRKSELAHTPAGERLHKEYRSSALESAVHEQNIKLAVTELRAESIEPVIIKGWAAAQFYPEVGLRPHGDLDISVHPRDCERAREILNGRGLHRDYFDVHSACEKFDVEPWEEVFARSRTIALDGTEVRVLSPEDHLRVLSIHFLRHGAWRPLWLCDIAAAVENRPADFDWQTSLGGDPKRRRWIECAIGLAHELLGAEIDDLPFECKKLPRWLVGAVFSQWERPVSSQHEAPEMMIKALRKPARVPVALTKRWPDPIQATVKMNCEFNDLPRLPFQLARCVGMGAAFVGKLVNGES